MITLFTRRHIAAALLLALAVCGNAYSGDGMSGSNASSLTNLYPVTWCNNIGKDCCCCDFKVFGDLKKIICEQMLDIPCEPSSHGSIIDNTSLNEISWADDYVPSNIGASAGCATCGGAAPTPSAVDPDGQLRDLRLRRFHRYRDMWEQSSFGPGVSSNFDVNLRITQQDDESYQVAVFDPEAFTRLLLTDSGSGVFKGPHVNHIHDLQFYTGSGGGGTQTANPTLAASSVMTLFDGYKYTFDVFDPTGSLPSPWKHGDIGSPGSWGNACALRRN